MGVHDEEKHLAANAAVLIEDPKEGGVGVKLELDPETLTKLFGGNKFLAIQLASDFAGVLRAAAENFGQIEANQGPFASRAISDVLTHALGLARDWMDSPTHIAGWKANGEMENPPFEKVVSSE